MMNLPLIEEKSHPEFAELIDRTAAEYESAFSIAARSSRASRIPSNPSRP